MERESNEVGVSCTSPDGNHGGWVRLVSVKVVRSGWIPGRLLMN